MLVSSPAHLIGAHKALESYHQQQDRESAFHDRHDSRYCSSFSSSSPSSSTPNSASSSPSHRSSPSARGNPPSSALSYRSPLALNQGYYQQKRTDPGAPKQRLPSASRLPLDYYRNGQTTSSAWENHVRSAASATALMVPRPRLRPQASSGREVLDDLTRREIRDEKSRRDIRDETTRRDIRDETTRREIRDELTRRERRRSGGGSGGQRLFLDELSMREDPSKLLNGLVLTPGRTPTADEIARSGLVGKRKTTEKLLPPIKPNDVNKKCLIIDLDETLVHSSFKVYVLKRPFVDEFLARVGEKFECVLFTASLAKYADPVADLLDKRGVFRSRLFREACVFHKGNYIKDLSRLGRDLYKTIIVDNSPTSYAFHPDNAIPVQTWFDDPTDVELLDILPLLDRLQSADTVYSVLQPHEASPPKSTGSYS